MNAEVIINAIIVAAITAAATGYINERVMSSHLNDLTRRIERIEEYLNGLLKAYESRHVNGAARNVK